MDSIQFDRAAVGVIEVGVIKMIYTVSFLNSYWSYTLSNEILHYIFFIFLYSVFLCCHLLLCIKDECIQHVF